MRKEDLDAIAERQPYCRNFGESVSLSRAERDGLVALAKKAVVWRRCDKEVPDTDVWLLVAGMFDGPHDWRTRQGFYSGETKTWHVSNASWKPIYWGYMPIFNADAEMAKEGT